jgi:ABC-type branched-subunit amino acid transport system substrate-binding protein
MRSDGRVASGALALVLLAGLVGGCTSDPDEQGRSGGSGSSDGDNSSEGAGAASTTGITDDTIRIGVIGADFGPLAEAGLAPELGDQPKILQSVIDQVNADGGIGGRQVEMRLTLVDGTAGAEAGQAACLEMTQDFGAFAVILTPAIGRDTARCTAVTNETLTLGATGFDDALYEEAEGRLFTAGSDTSMSTDRQAAGWARLLDAEGVLDGKTIGVVTAEQSPEFVAAAEDALIPTLEELGHEVPVNVTLPCPEGDVDCDQHEAGVQQMKDAGVDFVFMGAANLTGPTFVQAAENLDFHPQWAANGNQVTDTVAQFFESVAGAWDGAVGTSTVFALPEDLTDEAHGCNETVTERSGERYEPGSDAFGFAAVTCLVVQLVDRAGDEVDPADLDQASMIAAIEDLGEVPLNAGPPGTLSADKHDAGDYLFLSDFRAADGEFVQRDGDPVKVD